jgi:Uncharacterized KleE stable inheritance protein
MSKIHLEETGQRSLLTQAKPTGTKALCTALLSALGKVVWVVTALSWPVLKWVLSIITFFHGVRMLYHWNTPGVYAGWTFLAHFVALTALTCFVAFYKPRGL